MHALGWRAGRRSPGDGICLVMPCSISDCKMLTNIDDVTLEFLFGSGFAFGLVWYLIREREGRKGERMRKTPCLGLLGGWDAGRPIDGYLETLFGMRGELGSLWLDWVRRRFMCGGEEVGVFPWSRVG